MSTLSNRIRQRRIELNLSQEDLAFMIGSHQRQVSRYETGANGPTSDVLLSLAKALQTTPDWLLDVESSGLDPSEQMLIALYRSKDTGRQHSIIEVAKAI